ncbi:MAG TPA: formate dehydrogenase accessory protein FdhE [Blastocatellia bacterium]|nr:formate dehydrogenase accessory protein FdhE [Blastocatellia bacterium]
MNNFWDKWIQRADKLSSAMPEARELLAFYSRLLGTQREIYDYLRSRKGWLPSGSLAYDLTVVRAVWPKLLGSLQSNSPDALASEARALLEASDAEVAEMLIEYWRAPGDDQFFAKSFLQPYARWLADAGIRPSGRNLEASENRCPFCQGKPQVAFLKIDEPGAEVGTRKLMCSLCLSPWTFRRVVCANCKEERATQLGYYQAEQIGHVRIEVCETCKHYIKAVDLTKLGFAVPMVEEVATAALDLWARERGYTKIEMNLVGL